MGLWTLWTLCILVLAPCLIQGYMKKEVEPSCPKNKKLCEFHWNLSKQETMVWYNRTLDKGYPVLQMNGAFYRRVPENCSDIEPLTDKQLSEVATADGRYRVAYFINDQMPGPSIVVYKGQQVVVHVYNQLVQEGTSIHWHGQTQYNTPWMDGVAGITQCSIEPQQSFTYRFLANETGTHWYHSHYGAQRTDGFYGALIVLDPDEDSPNRTPKDQVENDEVKYTHNKQEGVNKGLRYEDNAYQSSVKMEQKGNSEGGIQYDKDYLMFVGDWHGEESSVVFTRYSKKLQQFSMGYDNLDSCHIPTQQADGSTVGTVPFESALINGKGRLYNMSSNNTETYTSEVETPREEYDVKKGKYYYFRAINPSMHFAFKIKIDKHKLNVIASDGNPLQPVEADHLILHGGERYDFSIQANQPVDNYWIRVETTERYTAGGRQWHSPGIARAILHYQGAPKNTEPKSAEQRCTSYSRCTVINCPFVGYAEDEYSDCINYDKLKSATKYDLPSVDPNTFEEHFLDFHFPTDKGGVPRAAVNGKQFLLPSTPPQVVGYNKYDHPCTEQCDVEPCQCTYQVNLTYGNMVQMAFISYVTPRTPDEVPGAAHPIHLHGHHFYVMKVGYPTVNPVTKRFVNASQDITCIDDRCSNVTWANQAWLRGNVPGLNEVNPPLKDTVTVPAGGYVVIRFMATNPGWWIMHCHLELHQVEGMALLVQEGDASLMNPPPKDFPKCGSFDWSSESFWDKIHYKPGQTTSAPQSTTSDDRNTTGAPLSTTSDDRNTTSPDITTTAPSAGTVYRGAWFYVFMVTSVVLLFASLL